MPIPASSDTVESEGHEAEAMLNKVLKKVYQVSAHRSACLCMHLQMDQELRDEATGGR